MKYGNFRGIMLAGMMVLALNAAPACAKQLNTTAIDADAPRGDNAVESLNADSLSAPPSMSMAASSSSTDSLASFGPSSGTVVGNRALELRDSILRLRASVNLNSSEFAMQRTSGAAGAVQYHSTVAAITARLQNGTTRGNPILLRQWEEANASLDEVTSSLTRLNSLQTAVDADASMASYLMESVQAAFQLSGAVDEDHDQLKLLQDEVSRLIVQLDYLRNQTASDIQRQTTYLTTERSNLQALSFAISRGELLGSSMSNRPVVVNAPAVTTIPQAHQQQQLPLSQQNCCQPTQINAPAPVPLAAPSAPVINPGVIGDAAPMSPREYMQESGMMPSAPAVTQAPIITPAPSAAPAPAPAATASAAPTMAPSVGRLLVLIRYNQPHVAYEEQLSKAVGAAIERRPDAQFSIVAVSPASGSSSDLAKDQEAARRDADDVRRSLIQLGLSPSRLTMANAQIQSASTPEVHVYIR